MGKVSFLSVVLGVPDPSCKWVMLGARGAGGQGMWEYKGSGGGEWCLVAHAV